MFCIVSRQFGYPMFAADVPSGPPFSDCARCVRCGEMVDEFSASVRFTGGRLCRHCISDAYCRLIAALEQPSSGESIVGAGDEDDEPQHDIPRTPWLLYIMAAIFGLALIGCALRLAGVL